MLVGVTSTECKPCHCTSNDGTLQLVITGGVCAQAQWHTDSHRSDLELSKNGDQQGNAGLEVWHGQSLPAILQKIYDQGQRCFVKSMYKHNFQIASEHDVSVEHFTALHRLLLCMMRVSGTSGYACARMQDKLPVPPPQSHVLVTCTCAY